jgi:hypothetical protein
MSNPFGKLKIERDEDEIMEEKQTKKAQEDLFAKENTKTKRKVKPSENKEKEVVVVEDTTTGFEKVGKAKRNVRDEEGQVQNDSKPVQKEKHKFKQNRGDQTFRHGNKTRQFDRHESGTGRGKEIKKEGHGGKGTWEGHGQKREIQDYDNTDYHFNRALNPRKEKETKYVAEEVVVAEVKTEEVVVAEVKTEEVVEAKEEKPEKVKPKTKQDLLDDAENEKNKLDVPENALTLSEWKAKNNKTTTTETVKTEKIKVDLDEFEARADQTYGISNPKAKKNKGAKNQKVSQKDTDLNKMLNLNIDDGTTRSYNNNNKNYNNKGGKKFNANDLPELK